MKFFNLITLCCYYISSSHAKAHPNPENLVLDLVQVLFRHGARTPIQLPFRSCSIADPSAYESYGFGELTNEGKNQAYEFGSFLRYRYNDHLSVRYDPRDISAYASDMSRTKTSLEFVLDGLYPQVDPAVWNHHLKWSRIPYSYTPNNLDALLGTFSNPKFLKSLYRTLESPVFKSTVANYSDFFNFVKEKNIISNCDSPLITAGLTYEVLVANEYMKLPLPEWYTTSVREQFKEIHQLAWDTVAGTRERQKIGSGSLIKTFIKNIKRNDNPKKIYLYAGHDFNICLFTRAHDIQTFRVPPFGSALILEKFHDSTNQTFLRLLAWDGIDKLEVLKLGNHEEYCPIEEYLKITETILPSEEEVDEILDQVLDETSRMQIKSLIFNIIKTL